MPASKARAASSAVASVWPAETTTPRVRRAAASVEGAGALGSERHLRHRTGREQALGQGEVGLAPRLGRVRAHALRREERALEMHAEHAGARPVDRDSTQGRHQVRLGGSDEGRLEGGRARRGEGLGGVAVGGVIRRGEVDPGEAVHLQVHEARDRQPSALSPVAEADGRDPSVGDLDVARHARAVDEGRGHAEPAGPHR